MGIKTEKKRIGAHEVQVSQLPAFAGLRMFHRLVRVAGPGLAKAYPAIAKKSLEEILEADVALVLEGVTEVATHCHPEEFEAIVRELLGMAIVDNRPALDGDFDVRFADELPFILEVVAFALVVNFRGFFGAWASRVNPASPAAPAPEKEASKSPRT